jgi:predicted ATPase
MDDPHELQERHIRETAEIVERLNPRNHPTLDDIARLHELHAQHERELGYEEKALAAEERARRVRALLANLY